VRRRVGEEGDELSELEERAWPAVSQHQGERRRSVSANVDEMDPKPVDVGAEMGKLVEPAFLSAPIETVVPVGHQVLEISKIRAVVPTAVAHLIRPSRSSQTLPEVTKGRLRDFNGERLHGRLLRCHLEAHGRAGSPVRLPSSKRDWQPTPDRSRFVGWARAEHWTATVFDECGCSPAKACCPPIARATRSTNLETGGR